MGSMEEHSPLTSSELIVLSELDSRQFGLIKLTEDKHARKRLIVLKAIRILDKLLLGSALERKRRRLLLLRSEEQNNNESSKNISNNNNSSYNSYATNISNSCATTPSLRVVDARIYCKLGHLRLLLQDYSKALSAYQKYFRLSSDPWRDPVFLYGLGLVYFAYNSFSWAIKAFRSALYADPSFEKAKEIHLRLGLMFKMMNDFESSLKHLSLASSDSNRSSLNDSEIQFHIGHLFEVSGVYKVAKEKYESLLKNENTLSASLKADIYRHLGWMYHGVDSLGEKPFRISSAIQCLQKSIESDPKSGQSLYLLGRCYASLGKVHEAFIAYRNSVDKSESNADTWCSIGVLYQQQNQPLDALQAYICAVQLNKEHTAAWTNLGTLYESGSQPMDALACYTNAIKNSKGPHHPSLLSRIKYLKSQCSNAPPKPQPPSSSSSSSSSTTLHSSPSSSSSQLLTTSGSGGLSKGKALLSVEEAWNLPISNEMTSRGPVRESRLPSKRLKNENGDNVNNVIITSSNNNNNSSSSGSTMTNMTKPSFYLNSSQLATLQFLQNQSSLHPSQSATLSMLQLQFRQMQQHQYQMRQQQQQIQIQQLSQQQQQQQQIQIQQQQQQQLAQHQQQQQQLSQLSQNVKNENSATTTTNNNNGILSGDLLADLSGKDLGSVSDKELEALLSQQDIGSFAENLLKQMDGVSEDSEKTVGSISESKGSTETENDETEKEETEKKRKKEVPSLKNVPTRLEIHRKIPSKRLDLRIDSTASDIAVICSTHTSGHFSTSLLPENRGPPSLPEKPKANLSKEQLLPPTPSVYLENKKDAFSPQLQEFCLQHPITVVRGIASALKMDLGLFSTKTLCELSPSEPIELRTQRKQSADENWDSSNTSQVWKCSSVKGTSTLEKYARYQMASFSESLREEQDKTRSHVEDGSRGGKASRKKTTLKFGYHVDLSDPRKWKMQLTELMKLPSWARVTSAGNALSHLGYTLQGLNGVRLSMKVPCARILAHQEPNNFCSININIGPGDSEWFGVPVDYWGLLASLCEKHNVNYSSESWWPNMRDLMDEEIPVYRFLQRPGDMVWINSGAVHWVQASGWSNSISWNVCPLTHKQYSLSIERYEWNKFTFVKSTGPMIHLSWNLARNIRLSERRLFESIKYVLLRSLRQIHLTLNFLSKRQVEVKVLGKRRSRKDSAHYCKNCFIEIFNVLFVKGEESYEGRVLTFCLDCALRLGNLDSFVTLQEYKLSELNDIYNHFKIHQNSSLSNTSSSSALTGTSDSSLHPLMSASGMAAALAAAASFLPSPNPNL